MKHLMRWMVLFAVVAVSACNLSTRPPTEEPVEIPTVDGSSRPVITITSPTEGQEFTVGAPVIVNGLATDSVGVTRVQLIANGQVVKTVSSDSLTGARNFDISLDYTPRQAGNVELSVVAFRQALASDPVSVNIVAKSATIATATSPFTSGPGSDPGPVIDPNDPTCRLLTNTGLNLRTGPGTVYPRLLVVPGGAVVPIVGRIADNTWWQVRYGVSVGWLSAQFVSVYGICTNVPVVPVPPTPTPTGATPTPRFTATPTPTPTPTITPTPGTPDLVISSISGPASVTVSATPVSYAITITNTGAGPTGQFTNQVTLPDGTTTDLGVVSNLNAGQSITLTIDITFSAAGTFSLQARADSGSTVTEISEVNNLGALSITVSP